MAAKSAGLTKSNTNNPVSLPTAMSITSRSQVTQLQRAMGQTGDEAGKPNVLGRNKLYVNTSKAFNINAYLNSNGATIDTPDSQWQHLGYTKRMVKNDIAKIDAGMKPLSQSVAVTRFVDGDALGKMIGDSSINNKTVDSLISTLSRNSADLNSFGTVLKNTDYTHKGYTSTTYVDSHGTFDSRAVRLNMVLTKGSKAIVTNNHAESEILSARGSKYNFTGNVRVVNTGKRDQLVIDVYI